MASTQKEFDDRINRLLEKAGNKNLMTEDRNYYLLFAIAETLKELVLRK